MGLIPPLAPQSGTVSEEDDFRNMSPYDALKLAAEYQPQLTDAQRGANGAQTLQDIARMVPGVSNALSLQDAIHSSGDAANSISSGDWMGALKNYGWAGVGLLGALTGGRPAEAPTAGAASRMNVFVPAGESAATKTARDLKGDPYTPATDSRIWKKTGVFFGPGGKPLDEVSDIPMAINEKNFKAGNYLPLSDVIDHPELFKRYPDFADIPVNINDQVTGSNARPIFRTISPTDSSNLPVGTMSMSDNFASTNPLYAKGQIAKLLQYKVNEREGNPVALRHGYDDIKNTFWNARENIPEGDFPPMQLDAYKQMLTTSIQRMKDMVNQRSREIRETEPTASLSRPLSEAAAMAGHKNAGNIDARQVSYRAMKSPQLSQDFYPYLNKDATFSSARGVRLSPEVSVVPPVNQMSPEDFKQFLNDWYSYGSGMPLPVQKGK